MIKLNITKKIITIFILFNLTPLFSKPQINISKETYAVFGENAESIRAYMNARSPVIAKGRKYDAYTKWRIRWRYRYKERTHSCKLRSIKVTIKVNYLLPELKHRHALNQSLLDDWDIYHEALWIHEQGHKDIGVEAGHQIEETLKNLPKSENCAAMKRIANSSARNILNEYIKKEKEYDLQTQHGVTQGAYFPRK